MLDGVDLEEERTPGHGLVFANRNAAHEAFDLRTDGRPPIRLGLSGGAHRNPECVEDHGGPLHRLGDSGRELRRALGEGDLRCPDGCRLGRGSLFAIPHQTPRDPGGEGDEDQDDGNQTQRGPGVTHGLGLIGGRSSASSIATAVPHDP